MRNVRISRSRFFRFNRLAALVLVVGITTIAVVMSLGQRAQHSDLGIARGNAAPIDPTGPEFHRNVTQIDLPKDASIFGERIPLENWEIRERFEREFYYNYQNADQLVLWWKRSQRIFPVIDSMLRTAGMPTDLKYLAIAESGLRNVKSPADANGFWQFVPETARLYGLRVDDYIDERLDPIRETGATIGYLQHAHAMFPSWLLVAASFNMGEDNVRIALDWQHASSYWNLYVNEETMRYVLRAAVIKELLTNGEKYGLDFMRLHGYDKPQVKSVTIEGPVASISDWAATNGYAYKDVKTLNPWIIGRYLPTGTYHINLPLTDMDRTTVK